MTKLRTITSPSGARLSVADQHGDRFQALVDDLESAGVILKKGESGGYNYRNIAGTNKLSNHAHGAAIDVNWNDNERGKAGAIDPELARSLAAKHGLTWGGDWKNPDPMHFEVAGPGHYQGDGHNHGPAPQNQPTSGQTVAAAPDMAQPQAAPAGGPPGGLLAPVLAQLGIEAPQQQAPAPTERQMDLQLDALAGGDMAPRRINYAKPAGGNMRLALARAASGRGRA